MPVPKENFTALDFYCASIKQDVSALCDIANFDVVNFEAPMFLKLLQSEMGEVAKLSWVLDGQLSDGCTLYLEESFPKSDCFPMDSPYVVLSSRKLTFSSKTGDFA